MLRDTEELKILCIHVENLMVQTLWKEFTWLWEAKQADESNCWQEITVDSENEQHCIL